MHAMAVMENLLVFALMASCAVWGAYADPTPCDGCRPCPGCRSLISDDVNTKTAAKDANIFVNLFAKSPALDDIRYGYMTLDSVFAGDTPVDVLGNAMPAGRKRRQSKKAPKTYSDIAKAFDGFILDVEVSMCIEFGD